MTAVRWVVVGNGRLGRVMAAGLRASGATVDGPIRREGRIAEPPADVTTAVLLCVPERALERAAARDDIPVGAIVGHCSASAPLVTLAPHERFSAHPLMTFTATSSPAAFHGVGCAIDGNTPRSQEVARALARALGMHPIEVPPERRALYHAAASMASNFLVTLEHAAERLARASGLDRVMLAPLVRASVENWIATGFEGAITGPIARGDRMVAGAQRDAVAAAAPELLPLWDALADATRAAAGQPRYASDERANRLLAEIAESMGITRPARVVTTIAGVRAAVAHARGEDRDIAFAPTMGALHEGHLSLIRRAHREGTFVVVSVFVNPTQFNDARDLEAYPRDLDGDVARASAAGADLVFAPDPDEVYPDGFATSVEVDGITAPLEGEARGTAHFRGVATVVSKLFNIVRPDVAYFGQKDAQQALVIRRMARDLDFPLEVVVCPTVRERDGLAMSSRNVRLSPAAREQATALYQCLEAMRSSVANGESDVARLLATGHRVLTDRGIVPADVEYLAVVDSDTLSPLDHLTTARETLIAIAARVGGVRLIDNILVTP